MPIYSLGDPDLYEALATEFGYNPGIYQLHIQNKSGEFERIKRLLDDDDQGIMYIGTSRELTSRLMTLKKSVLAAYSLDGFNVPTAHPCGTKIVQSPKFRERFPFSCLCLTAELCDLGEVGYRENDNTKLEWRKLSEYFSRFGEFLPLNG